MSANRLTRGRREDTWIGLVAQLVEFLTFNEDVVGPSPTGITKTRP